MHWLDGSFLLSELFFDGVGDGQVDFQHFGHQHVDNLGLVLLVVSLDFSDLLLGLLLELGLEFLIGFLDGEILTSALICSNSAYFYLLYLATSTSAASLASLSFLCLHQNQKELQNLPGGRKERCLPFFLSLFDDVSGILLSFKQLIDVGNITHVDVKIYQKTKMVKYLKKSPIKK